MEAKPGNPIIEEKQVKDLILTKNEIQLLIKAIVLLGKIYDATDIDDLIYVNGNESCSVADVLNAKYILESLIAL